MMKRPLIIVDHREQASGIPERLAAAGCAIEARALRVGDYLLPAGWVIERKSADDLAQSIITGRIKRQLESLSASDSTHPVLLLEGDEWQGNRRFRMPMLGRLYYELMVGDRIHVVYSPTPRITAALIEELARQLSTGPAGTSVKSNSTGLAAPSPHDLLLALPLVGPKRAEKLEADFKNLHELFAANLADVQASVGTALGGGLYGFFNDMWNARVSDSRIRPPRRGVRGVSRR